MKQFLPVGSDRKQTKQFQPAAEMTHTVTSNSPSFIDNRPETLAQRKLRETVNVNPMMLAQRKLGAAMNNSPRVVASFMNGSAKQFQTVPEEELLQGKFEAAQRLEEEEPLQGKFASQSPVQWEQQLTTKPNNTGLPDNLKNGIEALSGMSMDSVRVHYNSSQPAQLNALAYAQGTDIHVAPGQEQHLPHETWHVVQQAQGRVKPTMQMKDGVPINDDQRLERESDVMGTHATGFSPPVQRVIWSTKPLDGKQTDVNWTTDNLGGDTVGTEMLAKPLGPEHLQGGPPKSGAQKKLMNILPTDPELANPDKYIRGHLLNDNLGGPGEPYNLYPITANANKEHENVIESKVKQWVNTEKQWVSYHVKVNPGKIDLPKGIVNAQFVCTASVLNPANDQPINTISATINSEASVAHKTDPKNAMDLGKRAPVGSDANMHNALLSTSKKIGVVFDTETLGHLQYLFTEPKGAKLLKKLVMEYEGIGKGTAEALSKYSPETENDKKIHAALSRVYKNIGNEELMAIISDVYDEIF